jgi:hypothetical protein
MKKILLFTIIIFGAFTAFSQNDSLVLINGDVIIGELKSMDKGVAVIETGYSDDDLTIKWDGIKEIYTEASYLVTLSSGDRINGTVTSIGSGMLKITPETGSPVEAQHDNLVYLKSVDKGFWDRVYATIDIGFDLTKANNMTTFTTRSTLGYLANRWSTDFNFNTLFSKQDEADNIRRTDGGLTYKYFLPHDWYLPITLTYLSNTEQKLNARWNGLIGIGKYVIHSNHAYWGFSGGGAYNHENYTPVVDSASEIKSSWEGFVGTELNLFDIGDFDLLTNVKVFPGITEAGRWRADFNFDMKYDLPLDFYIKLGYSLNYDNQPVEGAADVDYVLHTGVGWEW